jgi:tRNA-specific 2-thiouridylase
MKKKVSVGLSGGVDSAVAAHLLIEQGYAVTGVFMKNWSGEDYGVADLCPWREDLKSATAVAEHLGIPLKVYNFEKEYRELVVKDFFKQYALGNTPNPDVLCNKFIKFDKFLSKAITEGADYIATGHYAATAGGSLFQAKDTSKDQTYFLHQLNSDQLSRTLFPLGEYMKSEVRKIAQQKGLPNAQRPDSQGICFIGEVDIVNFLRNELKEMKGDIVDLDSGSTVGEHKGVWFYTLGQRKGIGVGGSGEPYFVADKDVEKNILYVVKGRTNKELWSNTVSVKDLHLIDSLDLPKQIEAAIRYRSKASQVKLLGKNASTTTFQFAKKQWAPSPGQSLVLYSNGRCLGGGVISGVKSLTKQGKVR